jgi:hypothetical protein
MADQYIRKRFTHINHRRRIIRQIVAIISMIISSSPSRVMEKCTKYNFEIVCHRLVLLCTQSRDITNGYKSPITQQLREVR